MTTRHHNLWDNLALFPKDFEHWFGNWQLPASATTRPVNYPSINLETSPESYDYYVFAAGLDKTKLEITADHHVLSIKGEKPVLLPDSKDTTIHRSERITGKFERNLNLPHDVNNEHISASYNNGVLHIKAQRCGKSQPNTISVK